MCEKIGIHFNLGSYDNPLLRTLNTDKAKVSFIVYKIIHVVLFHKTNLKCIELNCVSPTLFSILSGIGKVITGLKGDPLSLPYKLRKLSYDQ